MKDAMKNIKKFENFVNENLHETTVEIEIDKIEPDERSNRKQRNKYHVNYQITIDGKLMEIEGILNSYNTGRSDEYEFEPTYFMDDETEEYYNNNWEQIEDEILNKFDEAKIMKKHENFISENFDDDDFDYDVTPEDFDDIDVEDTSELIDCIPYLQRVNNFIHRSELINWFNENDINYFNMSDLDMYIYYIEKNAK